jgi:hypothetical protein
MSELKTKLINYLVSKQKPNIDTLSYPLKQMYTQIGYEFVNIILQNNLIVGKMLTELDLDTIVNNTKPSIPDFVGKFCLNQNVLENIKTLKNMNSQQLIEIGKLKQIEESVKKEIQDNLVSIKNLETQNTQLKSVNETLTSQNAQLKSVNETLTSQNRTFTLKTDIQSQDTAYKCMTVNVFGGNTQTITNLGDLFDWLSPIDIIQHIPKVGSIRNLTQFDLMGEFLIGRYYTKDTKHEHFTFKRDTKFEYYFIDTFKFDDVSHREHDILLITFRNADVQRIVVKLINNVSVGGTNFRHMSIRKRLYTQKNASVARWKC